jgi:hypothetical protein
MVRVYPYTEEAETLSGMDLKAFTLGFLWGVTRESFTILYQDLNGPLLDPYGTYYILCSCLERDANLVNADRTSH